MITGDDYEDPHRQMHEPGTEAQSGNENHYRGKLNDAKRDGSSHWNRRVLAVHEPSDGLRGFQSHCE
jgi:hypothetical protein